MQTINEKITRPVDEYLKFIQQNFNTSDVSFADIIRNLEIASKQLGSGIDDRSRKIAEQADRLRKEIDKVIILKDFNKYKKFNSLGNFGLDNKGLINAYNVADDIIRDVQVARDWIDSYKKYSEMAKTMNSVDTLHNELIMLGQSILGRAIELTPIDTGFLRKSGVLYDFGTYIIIAFTAPYATYVHENLEIAHPIHGDRNCGGRAKFLEIALQEFFPNRRVWTEIHGYSGVMAKIGINPLYLEYSHYN